MSRQRKKGVSFQAIFDDPKYRGKHLVIVGDKIFAASKGKQSSKILERIMKRYPRQKPTLAYVPKADTLILWF